MPPLYMPIKYIIQAQDRFPWPGERRRGGTSRAPASHQRRRGLAGAHARHRPTPRQHGYSIAFSLLNSIYYFCSLLIDLSLKSIIQIRDSKDLLRSQAVK
jgi:hypothetical protein